MKRRTETLELEETGSSPVERLTYTVQRPVLGAPKPYPIRRPSAGGENVYPMKVTRLSQACSEFGTEKRKFLLVKSERKFRFRLGLRRFIAFFQSGAEAPHST